jgi:hypothetical protein
MKKNNFVKTDKNCQYPTGEGKQCASRKMTAQEWKKVCEYCERDGWSEINLFVGRKFHRVLKIESASDIFGIISVCRYGSEQCVCNWCVSIGAVTDLCTYTEKQYIIKKVFDIPDIVKEFENAFSLVLSAYFGESV